MKITRIGPVFGAEVSDVDLSDGIDVTTFAAISEALTEHEVLVFPGQPISAADQLSFGRGFGELVISPFSPNAQGAPELIVLDYSRESPARLTDVWHADETYRPCPPKITILKSVITPELGGDTMFCSMRAAYSGLSDRMKRHIAGLTAKHGFGRFSRLLAEDPDRLHQVRQLYPHPNHPVVTVHPDTGHKVLYVNRHFTEYIVELPDDESRTILELLLDQTARPEHQLRVSWKPGTIVMWDNRSVQHYAPHDYWPQRRRMERVTIAGQAPVGDGESSEVRWDRVEVRNVAIDRSAGLEAPSRPHER